MWIHNQSRNRSRQPRCRRLCCSRCRRLEVVGVGTQRSRRCQERGRQNPFRGFHNQKYGNLRRQALRWQQVVNMQKARGLLTYLSVVLACGNGHRLKDKVTTLTPTYPQTRECLCCPLTVIVAFHTSNYEKTSKTLSCLESICPPAGTTPG